MELAFLGIGDRLREARLARGIAVEQAQAETRIRSHYLEALEEERFESLPGEAYARAFLRSYADYLGLDGAELLAAYDGRVRRPPPELVPRRTAPPLVPAARAGVLVAALVLAAAAIALAGWQLAGDGSRSRGASPGAAPTTAAPTASAQGGGAAAAARTLVLAATGATRLEVRVGGPRGRRLWSGTLRRGQTLRFGLARPVWLRAGEPRNLRARVGGKPRALPRGAATIVVTADTVRAA